MAQHFLLSPSARDLSIGKLWSLSDEEAYSEFLRIRYSDTNGEPVCPYCGCVAAIRYKCRPILKCKGCGKQYSPTSGTPFEDRKLPFKKILVAIALAVGKGEPPSSIDLSIDLGVHYKTAFVLIHKIREIMARQQEAVELEGPVAIDVSPYGGFVRPKNVRKERKDRRKVPYRRDDKSIVLGAIREKTGLRRAKVCLLAAENDLLEFVYDNVFEAEEVHSDAAHSFNVLDLEYDHRVVNHDQQYSSPDACTNIVENLFSRTQKAESRHGSIARQHAYLLVNEAAWRTSWNRIEPSQRYTEIGRGLSGGPSHLRGYWQGTRAWWVRQRDFISALRGLKRHQQLSPSSTQE